MAIKVSTQSSLYIFGRPMHMAFDVNISNKDIGAYARAGNIIVCVAQEAEPDDTWIDRAILNGAEIFISYDVDIGAYIDRHNLDAKWLEPFQPQYDKDKS